MFEAHILANMPDDETADILAGDAGWTQAQWPDCVTQAQNASHTVIGDPVYKSWTKGQATEDGFMYDFLFEVPTS